jgi:methyl-accepting chemotaxis protein
MSQERSALAISEIGRVSMFFSVKSRIVFGFGFVMALLIAATIANLTLVSGISTGFDQFQSALNRKTQAIDIDLVMTKVRVRVNQWLRSPGTASFAKQADELLTQDLALLAEAAKSAKTEKEKETLAQMDRALKAYIESWHVVQGLYSEEAKIYDERVIAPSAAIRAILAKLRDDDALDQTTSRLIAEARDDFMASESIAFQYRSSLKQSDADQLKAVITHALAALTKAAPDMKTADNSDLLKKAAQAIGAWRDAFGDAVKVAQTRITRLGSWTVNEGEVMVAGSDVLRVEGVKATDGAQAGMVATIARVGMIVLVMSGTIVLIGFAFSWGLARSITRPIVNMVDVLQKLADHDSSFEIPGTERRDEIGQMAKAAQVFKDNMIEADRLRADRLEGEQQTAARRKADMDRLAGDFEAAVGKIIETVSSASTELEDSAGTLTSTAARAQELATIVAGASEEASANVQSVASATEQMSLSVDEISRQVQESANIAREAVDQARQTNEHVAQLANAASRIGDVVELINTIAGQTNLLALNATIEAARAGEAGRGFAVVASEVKALAEQTAKATGEIGQQISGIQSATNDSVKAIQAIGGTIGWMSEICSTIASAVEQQGAATREISRNVQQAAQGTRGERQHRRRATRRQPDRNGVVTGVVGREVALKREQPVEAGSRKIPQYGPRGLKRFRASPPDLIRSSHRFARQGKPCGRMERIAGHCAIRTNR